MAVDEFLCAYFTDNESLRARTKLFDCFHVKRSEMREEKLHKTAYILVSWVMVRMKLTGWKKNSLVKKFS